MEQSECISKNQLDAYLRREQSEAEIMRFEEHLVVCRACRLTLLSLQEVTSDAVEGLGLPTKLKQEVSRLPQRQSSFLARRPQAPALAIAALLLIAITAGGLWQFTSKTWTQNANSEAFRADRKRRVALRAVSPTKNAALPAPAIEFKWTPEADALRYTVVVLDESGDVVHQAETTTNYLLIDTTQARIQPEKKYFWRVRAKLTDGTEVEMALSSFYVDPK